ncbi:aspartokinase 2, chloroplastic-like [Triticum urartu]|uniref:aspartokinase 2, chloroplastic-like n=1 Tax=Triticum urartu TaxID=4572 RepID=UPI002044470B|nr:aspartokinase 2, chloroplastic-like [Triticum urartu]
MVEIGLEQQQAGEQLVLCKVYKSQRPRSDAEASTTEACSVPGGAGDNACPAPPPAAAAPSSPSCDHQVTERKTTTLGYDLHSPGPGVGRKPPLSFKHGTRCRPMGGSRSGVAIVKKASAAAVTVVMKFGGSLTRSADRMKEMAKLVLSLDNPVVVVSAIGNTTDNLLEAAWKALSCGSQEVSQIHELATVKELHFRMIGDLGLHKPMFSGSLDELENILMGIAIMKELTPKTRDYLVSFGEHMSTRIFSAYLNNFGEGSRQVHTLVTKKIWVNILLANAIHYQLGDFQNVSQYLAVYHRKCMKFQEWELYAVNTRGKGGSDLTATTIGRDLGSREIQVWMDVDGVLTCDPNVCANAIPLPHLTFGEAAELGLFGAEVLSPQSMQQAMEGGIPVIVKNLCNPQARGTKIAKTRYMSKNVLTSIVSRSQITMLNIESRRILDQSAFLATSFSTLGNFGIAFDCVAISDGKISLIVIPSKMSSHELLLYSNNLDNVAEELQKLAVVTCLQDRSVISLIGNNTQMSSTIFLKAVNVLRGINVDVQKFSQGSSEVMKVSLVVADSETKHCVQVLHSAFFGNVFVREVQEVDLELNGSQVQEPENSPPVGASSSDKRKTGDEHLVAPPNVRQKLTSTEPDDHMGETEHQWSPDGDPMAVRGDNINNPEVLPSRGGEQSIPQPATGDVPDEGAGEGFWTETMMSQVEPFMDKLFPTSEWDPTNSGRYALLSNVPPPRRDESMEDLTSFDDFDPLWMI